MTLPGGLTVNYKYDALGRRIQRTTSGGADERFVYDGQDGLLDLNASLAVTTSYLNGLGIDDHLRQTNTTTGVSYFLTDHLGSTSALTDAAGTVVETLNYDAFGNNSGSTRTRYTYTARERDADTGLLYYRARFYDPQLGRFISEDPIGLEGRINLFAYVENNPVLNFDPSGLCSQKDKNPCADPVLVAVPMKDDSGKLNPFMNRRVAPLFLGALAEIQGKIPNIAFSRAFRTREEQTELWNNRRSNPNPVARPGTSRHESGFAVDVSGVVVRTPGGGYAKDKNDNLYPLNEERFSLRSLRNTGLTGAQASKILRILTPIPLSSATRVARTQ